MSMGENMHKEEPQMTVQPPAALYQACSETAESCHCRKPHRDLQMSSWILQFIYFLHSSAYLSVTMYLQIAEPFVSCLF